MQKIAIFPASFDPITTGHLDLIIRASKICDKLIILVANNFNKKYLIPEQKRFELVSLAIKSIGLDNVEIYASNNLTIEEFYKHQASYLIRGVRNYQDFEYENNLSLINQDLLTKSAFAAEVDSIETIYLVSRPDLKHISSSMIRELATNKEYFIRYAKYYVPEVVYNELLAYLFP